MSLESAKSVRDAMRWLRANRFESDTALAEALDRSQPAVSKLLKSDLGEGQPRAAYTTAQVVANLLGVDTDELLRGAWSPERKANAPGMVAGPGPLAPDSGFLLGGVRERAEKMGQAILLDRAARSRFPNLELCVLVARANGQSKWSPDTLAAAAAGHFGDDDVRPDEWASRLDRLEAVLRHAAAPPIPARMRP